MGNRKKALRKELNEYSKNGIRLQLNHVDASPEEIARACACAEEGAYMRDYELDAEGRLTCLGFDKIKRDR